MQDALNMFTTIINFMRVTPILAFEIGGNSLSITFLDLAVGTFCVSIGIVALHKIFEW